MYLGIDIGGTFTDLVLMDEHGAISTAKAPTTPGRLEEGVFEAVRLAAAGRGLTSEELLGKVKTFGHGTTQATNALIERDGAVTGLITTRGFGDTLLLQRLMGFTAGLSVDQLRWYSRRRSPNPIVPRRFIREVPERIDQAGKVVLALDEIATRRAVQELAELGVQTFAVSLLWSFRNASHERRIAEIIREVCPGSYLSLSCDVAPVIGEYERTATTTLNSYLSLKVASYLEKIEQLLRADGFAGAFYVLNSSGGVVPAAEAARKPVLLVASGPTGGVMGSMQLAHNIGEKNIITTDMGGTSFDVAIIAEGKPIVSGTREVGGYHLATPMIDIRTIGAGGGSIAVVEGGQLRVGPESAGADPGPVCYGKGGKRVTVTDADVVLGIISTENFLGGRMKLDRDAAVRAVREQIADPLGVSVERAAAGIRSVVDGRMADLLREVTVGRGHDPRDFTLFAYGGAGPVHCSGYGADLGVARILIPATSMAHSAYGALASDIHQTAERSLMLRGGGGSRAPSDDIDAGAVARIFDELQVQCLDATERAGIRRQDAEMARSVDIRYRRQTHDLIVPVPAGPITAETVAACVNVFQETYEAVYGKGAGLPQAGIELSTFRVAATGRVKKPIIRGPDANKPPSSTPRQIFEPTEEKFVSASVWDWQELIVDFRISGPAVIEHPETTIYVAPGQTARMDNLGNIVIELKGHMKMAKTVYASSPSASIDPISFEVIRNKLQAIVEEQAITLQNVSGSAVVTEATDFNCGLYLADGSIVVMGPQVIMFAGIMSSVIRSVIDTAKHNPGIREGDMFVFNDPYRGAIHQPDISIVAPIFCEGVHVAWVGACAHQLDIGGMTFGSMAYAATEIQQEALLLPGIRIIEQGVLREDIWQMIMGMTRLPHVVALDLKAMIAANNVAIRRFNETVDRYGADVVVNVMKAEIDASETRLRQRLRQIPDGTYRARDFLEHDGHSNRLYEICVTVLKEGDTLTFDMEGSSPQAPGFINCTFSGLKGSLFSGLLPILAPDMRWNEGILRPVTIRAPEASVCNAKWPAPVSGATICAAWVVVNATVAALSRMVACTPGWLQEGQAVTKGHQMILTLAGADRDGSPYGTFFMDALAGGGGAFVDHDGLDGSGDYVIPRPSIANVEAHEAGGPILFLFRSFLPNTAGAGRMRGGYSASLAVTPHDVEGLHSMVIGHGVEVPNSAGLFGGRPGACGTNLVKRNGGSVESLVREIGSGLDFIKAGQRLGAKPGNMPFHYGDVLGYTIQGGGGYGDPIIRNPDRVAADVAEGFLTPHWAEALYGVTVDNKGHLDLEKTCANRAKIRCDRLGGKEPEREPPKDENLPHLRVGTDRHTLCGCGYDLAGPGESWKQRAIYRDIEPETCGPHVHLHDELKIVEFACPKCATLLEVEVCRHEQEPLTTMLISPR